MTTSLSELRDEQLTHRLNQHLRAALGDPAVAGLCVADLYDEMNLGLFMRVARKFLTNPACTVHLTIGEELTSCRVQTVGSIEECPLIEQLAVGVALHPCMAVARLIVQLAEARDGKATTD